MNPKQPLKNDFCCPIKPDFDFGRALQELYPILPLVFRYLPIKDIKSALEVNEIWAEYVEKELSERKFCGYFNRQLTRTSVLIERSNNFDFINVDFVLIFGNKRHFSRIKFNTDDDLFMDILQHKWVELGIKPYGYYVRKLLPNERRLSCSGLILPKLNNITIKIYENEHKGINNISDELQKDLDNGLEVKALLYFYDYELREPLRYLEDNLKYILEKQADKKFALGGGAVLNTMEDVLDKFSALENEKPPFQHLITFLSPPNFNGFEAHSVVIDYETSFGEKLQEVQHNITLKKHSTAILFQCSQLKRINLKEFTKYFPSVSYICVGVEGEIGWDNFDDISRRRKSVGDHFHTYSVIVVILTWD